jgi:predicted RND superfamily exporter protein
MVLSGGFFIFTASFLKGNIRFGWLTGCAVLLALAADIFLVPALLTLAMRRKKGIADETFTPPPAETVQISRD